MLLHSSADCCLQLGATRVCLQHGESVFLSPSLFREEVHILNAQLAPFTLIPLWRAGSGPSLRSLHASFTSRAEGRQVDVVFPGRREWVNGLLFSAPVPARQQFTILGSLTAGEEGAWHFVDVVEVKNASLALFGLLADESFARLRVVSTLPQRALPPRRRQHVAPALRQLRVLPQGGGPHPTAHALYLLLPLRAGRRAACSL